MRCSNNTAGSHFLGNLLLVLLRTPVVILVLFPLCEYAGSRAPDNICGDQTWCEASAEKKSHRKIALEQSQLAEIKVGQKLKKCGVPPLGEAAAQHRATVVGQFTGAPRPAPTLSSTGRVWAMWRICLLRPF